MALATRKEMHLNLAYLGLSIARAVGSPFSFV